jgi:hypothetical protein
MPCLLRHYGRHRHAVAVDALLPPTPGLLWQSLSPSMLGLLRRAVASGTLHAPTQPSSSTLGRGRHKHSASDAQLRTSRRLRHQAFCIRRSLAHEPSPSTPSLLPQTLGRGRHKPSASDTRPTSTLSLLRQAVASPSRRCRCLTRESGRACNYPHDRHFLRFAVPCWAHHADVSPFTALSASLPHCSIAATRARRWRFSAYACASATARAHQWRCSASTYSIVAAWDIATHCISMLRTSLHRRHVAAIARCSRRCHFHGSLTTIAHLQYCTCHQHAHSSLALQRLQHSRPCQCLASHSHQLGLLHTPLQCRLAAAAARCSRLRPEHALSPPKLQYRRHRRMR